MPAPSSIVLSASVPAPIDRVFEVVGNPERLPQWLPACKGVTGEGERRKGARWKLRMQSPFRTTTVEVEILEYTRPTGLGWVELAPRSGVKVYWQLRFAGGQTSVTMKSVWTPPGLRAWLLGTLFRRRSARRTFEGAINNLRKLVTA